MYANQREKQNENGIESRIWGENGYSGVKKARVKIDYFGKSSIIIYFCIGWKYNSFYDGQKDSCIFI
ncbi:MAG: hypothetical protein WCR12_09680 [Dysgonamonadaceae bacterium]